MDEDQCWFAPGFIAPIDEMQFEFIVLPDAM